MSQCSRYGAAMAMHLLRARRAHEHGKVTFIELFFDLVFVFAVTQLSHGLLAHLSWTGAAQTAFLLMAVWWVWIYTSWVTNWLDPERAPVRILLLVLMLAGLALSASLPEAFGSRAAVFAGAHVFIQVGRGLFMQWALLGHGAERFRNFLRINAWLGCAGILWLAGATQEGGARYVLWALALAIEYAGPALGFFTPGLGRSSTADWDVDGAHMAERCALFIIIALGESILVTGATLAGLDWTPITITSFLVSFVAAVAMWWIYFDSGAERGSHHISASGDPGRLARLAYTYIHLLPVAGIIVTAVADELVLSHPLGHDRDTDGAAILAVLGGPALYLLGVLLFKRVIAGRVPLSHLAGLVLLAVLVPAAPHLTPLLLSAATTAVLIAVCVWEGVSLRDSRRAARQRA